MRWFLIIGFCLVAACSRPLTPNEVRFAEDVFGDGLETRAVRVSRGFGGLPAPREVEGELQVFRTHPKACLRVPQPRSERPPPRAFALYNRMHFFDELYSGDMALPWPYALRFPNALIFAHELTHVWQWQNREITGYSPWSAAAESWTAGDPYFSNPEDRPVFLSFGYEQQAAMVEDFLCFLFANPDHPKRKEIQALLAPVFPVDTLEEKLSK